MEKVQRKVEQILKLKKQLPDIEDASILLTKLRDIDKQLDIVIRDATGWSQFVRTT